MKILLTGANGFLGQHLVLHFASKGFEVVATGRGNCKIPPKEKFAYHMLELADAEAVNDSILAILPDIIVHTAAMSKPDECDKKQDECLLNNVTATQYLVEASNLVGAHFIYVSTDFVFGEGGLHTEEDEPAPLNFYGQSKFMAEKLVAANAHHYAIMRPVFIYGEIWEGIRPTFLHWVKNNLEQGKTIKVVNDQLRTPTHVLDLCKGLEAMINKKAAGIFHLAGKEIITPFEMAVQLAEILGLDKNLIESVTAETFPEPVKRAKKAGLGIEKAVRELGYAPSTFQQGVELTFR